MIKPKLDNVIQRANEDGTIGGGHLGGNERPLAKYMPKEQTPLKKTKKMVKKGK